MWKTRSNVRRPAIAFTLFAKRTRKRCPAYGSLEIPSGKSLAWKRRPIDVQIPGAGPDRTAPADLEMSPIGGILTVKIFIPLRDGAPEYNPAEARQLSSNAGMKPCRHRRECRRTTPFLRPTSCRDGSKLPPRYRSWIWSHSCVPSNAPEFGRPWFETNRQKTISTRLAKSRLPRAF